MGTGYTTLDPARRKFPPLIDSSDDDEASTEVETDVGEAWSSPASSHATRRGISDDRRVTSGETNS